MIIDRDGDVITHRAFDRVLLRPVALSMFPAGQADDLAPSPRWRAARLLAGLTHPALLPVYDAGEYHHDGPTRGFVVTPLLEGPGLAELLERGALPLDALLATGAALAGALACVHHAGLTHRGLTPRSISCDAAGRPYLREFTLAAATDATAVTADALDPTGGAYLAPEQVTGDTVGPAADIYALGLILLECATGYPEYPSPTGQLAAAARARLHRPPLLPAALPHPLRQLLAAMTARHPGQRPTADHLAVELHHLEHAAETSPVDTPVFDDPADDHPASPTLGVDPDDPSHFDNPTSHDGPDNSTQSGASADHVASIDRGASVEPVERSAVTESNALVGSTEQPPLSADGSRTTKDSATPAPDPSTPDGSIHPPVGTRSPMAAGSRWSPWSVGLLVVAALILGLVGGFLGGLRMPAAPSADTGTPPAVVAVRLAPDTGH